MVMVQNSPTVFMEPQILVQHRLSDFSSHRDFVSQLNIWSVRLLHYEYVCGDQWAVNHIFCFIFLLHLSHPS